MPLLYETVVRRPRRFQVTKYYRVPFSDRLFTGWAGGSASETKFLDIRWDERVTTLYSVNLKGTLHAVQPFAAPSVGFMVSVNGLPVASRDWLGGCVFGTFDVNVYGKIVNGANTFLLEIHKNTVGLGDCGFESILVEVVAVFTGAPPEVKPTPITWADKLMDFLDRYKLYLIGGTLAIGGIYVASKAIPRKKK